MHSCTISILEKATDDVGAERSRHTSPANGADTSASIPGGVAVVLAVAVEGSVVDIVVEDALPLTLSPPVDDDDDDDDGTDPGSTITSPVHSCAGFSDGAPSPTSLMAETTHVQCDRGATSGSRMRRSLVSKN